MKIFGRRKETVEIPGFGMGAEKKKKKRGNFKFQFVLLGFKERKPKY